jgi:hypothetical protein
MGEARRKRVAELGDKGAEISGQMRIVRYRDGAGAKRRVEFFIDGLAKVEAYAAICNIKRRFEDLFAFREDRDGGLAPRVAAPSIHPAESNPGEPDV